jgi:hypothetical protein
MIPRLDAAAERLGTTRAQLIGFCTKTFLEAFERKGMALMPPNWEELLHDLDGRAHRYAHLRESRKYPRAENLGISSAEADENAKAIASAEAAESSRVSKRRR